MKKIAGNPLIKTDSKGRIFVDLVSLEDFLKNFDTPIMIFLENRIINNVNTFQNVFKSIFGENKFFCFYSMKANFLPEICQIISSLGIGSEIIGLPELKLALKNGFPPEKIIIGGPYLPKNVIFESVKNNIKEIIVYNLNILKSIDLIAQKSGKTQNICLRVNSEKFNSRLGVKLNEKNLEKLKNVIKDCKNIKITTILSHYTTQMNNIEKFLKNIEIISENVKKLREIGINIENINLGGGFPEATIMKETQLIGIARSMKKTIESSNFEYNQIYFEPGRYFVGDAGLFLTEIINVNEDRWIFLNLGNNICPKFAKCSLRFYNISQINKPHKYKTSIAGIVPTDQDVLAKDYFFTYEINENDKILITNVGAYALTFSNRFPYTLPKMFLVKDKNYKLIFDPNVNHDISIF